MQESKDIMKNCSKAKRRKTEKMKIPQKLKVGGRIYTVRFQKQHKDSLLGQVNHTTRKITLYRYSDLEKVSPRGLEECLIHEILHTINSITDISLKETYVNRLSEALYQVLKDNHLLKE